MTPPPIDPSLAVAGGPPSFGGVSPEWSVGSVAPSGDGVALDGPASGSGGGGGFGEMLANQIEALDTAQNQGAEAARSLATGTATDLPSVVAAVERARLSMELASQVRTRAVEAYQEIFRTQV